MKRRASALFILAAVLPACDSGSVDVMTNAVLESVTPTSPATAQLPSFNGRAAAGALVEIFTNPTASGAPAASGTATSLGSFSLTVSVAKPSGATFYAFSTPARSTRSGPSNGLFYGCRDGGFAAPLTLPTGTLPWEIVSADFNGDGKPDLAVSQGGTNDVAVFLGVGDGTFTSPAGPFAAGSGPRGLATGDWNLDGFADLAVANIGADTLSILLGAGDGTFTTLAAAPATGSSPFFVAAGDVNGDFVPDLAVANFGGTAVTLLLGLGDGTFGAGTPLAVGTASTGLVITDLDGLGGLDLAVVSNDALYVWIGQGDGTFMPAAGSPFATQGSGSLIALDLNGDGRRDLVFADFLSDVLSSHLGTGAGVFTAAAGSPFAAGGSNPQFCALADLDGDGRVDAAVTLFGSDAVAILPGDGTGSFGTATTTAVGANPRGLLAGDWNGDGLPDLAVADGASNTLRILLSK